MPEDATGESFGTRLRFLWKRSHLTADELAQALEVSPSTFGSWIASKTLPGLENLVRIEEVTGIAVQWLATGRAPMMLDSSVVQSLDDAAGFVFVPRYDVRVSAGTGQIVESEEVKSFLAFREDWVRSKLRRNPKNLAVVEAFGDSMMPTIADGDIMLVDTSELEVRGPAIYVVLAGNAAIVKRVELKMDGSVVVKSDNPAYEPYIYKPGQVDQLRVLGKVVWAGGML
jgi:phage repressor protein C with HTH and peptisase S24 domain